MAKKLGWFMPILHIRIEIPFVRIQTWIIRRDHNQMTTEYVGLFVCIWKWKWEIALYDIWERIENRRKKDG